MNPRSTVMISPSPYSPLRDITNCGVAPSTLSEGPVTDHCPGISETPPTPCASIMVVAMLADFSSSSISAPVDDAALLRVRTKSSGPSIKPSSTSDRSIMISVIEEPSAGDVYSSVPVAGLKLTSGLPATAA